MYLIDSLNGEILQSEKTDSSNQSLINTRNMSKLFQRQSEGIKKVGITKNVRQ